MDPFVMALSGLIFIAVLLALVGIGGLAGREAEEVRARVQRLAQTSAGAEAVLSGRQEGGSFLGWFARLARPKEGSDDLSRMRAKLSYAGLRGPRAVEGFFAAKLLLAVGLAGGAVALSALRATPVTNIEVVATLMAAVGFYAPNVWLQGRVTKVQTELSRGLPDVLDLLTTCVEAGLGIEAALQRISLEIGLAAPRLAREIEQTLAEIRAGVRRAEAFRRLAQRTGVEELRNLAAILIQTEMFGTSIASALRVHSAAMRVRRTHRAEERAAKIGVKMLLPLVFFLLPSLFVVIMGPAVIRIAKTLMPALGGD